MAGTVTNTRGQTAFNQVTNYDNLGLKTSKQVKKDEIKSQRIFKNCSEYLDSRFKKQSMHREIENLEGFLFKVKQVFRGDKAPPIVIRS